MTVKPHYLLLFIVTLAAACGVKKREAKLASTSSDEALLSGIERPDLNLKDHNIYLNSVILKGLSLIEVSVKPQASENNAALALVVGQIYPEYTIQDDAASMDKASKVEYFTAEKLHGLEVHCTPSGRFFYKNAAKPQFIKPNLQEHIFVLDKTGKMYVTEASIGGIHHSSFLSGGNVAAAGSIVFDESGKIMKFDNSTGHYKVPNAANVSVLTELSRRGVSLEKLEIGAYGQASEFKKIIPGNYAVDKDFFKDRANFAAVEKTLDTSYATRTILISEMEQNKLSYEQTRNAIEANKSFSVAERNVMHQKANESFYAVDDKLKAQFNSQLDTERALLEPKNAYYNDKLEAYRTDNIVRNAQIANVRSVEELRGLGGQAVPSTQGAAGQDLKGRGFDAPVRAVDIPSKGLDIPMRAPAVEAPRIRIR